MTGLATRRALDRIARQHAAEEQRGMEFIAAIALAGLAIVVGIAAMLIADHITGLQIVADWIRGRA